MRYFNEKRWDLSVKYLKLYLEANPEDSDIQEKILLANRNASEGIRLYKSAKAAEKDGDLKRAYEIYKTSYQIYPLLYDTWERIQDLKKKCQ